MNPTVSRTTSRGSVKPKENSISRKKEETRERRKGGEKFCDSEESRIKKKYKKLKWTFT